MGTRQELGAIDVEPQFEHFPEKALGRDHCFEAIFASVLDGLVGKIQIFRADRERYALADRDIYRRLDAQDAQLRIYQEMAVSPLTQIAAHEIRVTDEISDKGRCGAFVNVARRSDLNDLASIHDRDLVG